MGMPSYEDFDDFEELLSGEDRHIFICGIMSSIVITCLGLGYITLF